MAEFRRMDEDSVQPPAQCLGSDHGGGYDRAGQCLLDGGQGGSPHNAKSAFSTTSGNAG